MSESTVNSDLIVRAEHCRGNGSFDRLHGELLDALKAAVATIEQVRHMATAYTPSPDVVEDIAEIIREAGYNP